MSENKTILHAGRLAMLDQGEYSDYGVTGFFVALKDFDPVQELKIFLTENPEYAKEYRFSRSGFIAFMIARGLLLEIQYSEIYLGAYSSFDSFRFTP